MRDFFKGWRRKAGCALLVVALILVGWWIRSRHVEDQLHLSKHLFVSRRGRFGWVFIPYQSQVFLTTRAVEQNDDHPLDDYAFTSGTRVVIDVSYCLLAVPLTLLSAYLILWKPRTKPTK